MTRHGCAVEMTKGTGQLKRQGTAQTRNSQSVPIPFLRPSVAHLDTMPDDFGWHSVRMCLLAASEHHRPALRISGWAGASATRNWLVPQG
jgi:hypothetical protein